MNVGNKEFRIGIALKKLRGRCSLRQIANWSGVSNSYLSQVESGARTIPTLKVLKRLADVYNIRTSALIAIAEGEKDGLSPWRGLTVEETQLLKDYKSLSKAHRKHLQTTLKIIKGCDECR